MAIADGTKNFGASKNFRFSTVDDRRQWDHVTLKDQNMNMQRIKILYFDSLRPFPASHRTLELLSSWRPTGRCEDSIH